MLQVFRQVHRRHAPLPQLPLDMIAVGQGGGETGSSGHGQPSLHVETDVHDVSVGDHVVLPLDLQLSGLLYGVLGSILCE